MAKIKYLYDGKEFALPKETIDIYMKNLSISFDEACLMWLEEEEKIINPDYEKINRAAESVAKEYTKAGTKKETKKRKPRPPKEDPAKQSLINELYNTLCAIDNITEVEITNKTKVVEFTMGTDKFKLDLIRRR